MSLALRLGLVAVTAGLLIGPAAAAHDEKSGRHWLRKCTNPEPNWQIECAVYVRALVEYDEVRARSLGQRRFICPNGGVTLGQSREIVIRFLRERGTDLDQPFALLAHRALAAAFPCPGAPPQ